MTLITHWHDCYNGNLRGLITPASFAHPAKMARRLCERILEHGHARGYWKPGDLLLDPFAGIFTTGLLGAYRGYHVLGIELEQKFFDLANENIAKNAPKLNALGRPRPVIIQGDSRNLITLLVGAGLVPAHPAGAISSPPYADTDQNYQEGWSRFHDGHTPLHRNDIQREASYGDSHGQLSELPPGDIESVVGAITSPPWGTNVEGGLANFKDAESFAKIMSARDGKGHRHGTTPKSRLAQIERDSQRIYGNSEGQIGNMPAGAITSPPYNLPMSQDHNGARGGQRGSTPSEDGAFAVYGNTPGQLEGLENGDIDSIVGAITSPPYVQSVHDGNGIDPSKLTGNPTGPLSQAFAEGYGTTTGQLGAESGDTYWAAVAQIYQQLFTILPPGGALAIVVKDYVKNKQIVPLCDQTAHLLQAIGFTIPERIHAMLVKEHTRTDLFGQEHVKRTQRKSFFRRLAEKKGSPPIDYEEVIWAVKP